MSHFYALLISVLLTTQVKSDSLCNKLSLNSASIDQPDASASVSPKTLPNCVEASSTSDDVYVLQLPSNRLDPFCAYCIHTNNYGEGGWMIIQRREDGSESFDRNWTDYKNGFGSAYGEYWIGLECMHAMTKDRPHELWISLKDFEGHERNVKYSSFSIGSEDEDYKLSVSGYEAQVNKDFDDDFGDHNGMKFSTHDVDNSPEKSQCAQKFKGGWWYVDCYRCNLNGVYYPNPEQKTEYGINWISWLDYQHSLKYTHMAIRPREREG